MFVLLLSCSTTHGIKPVGKGNVEAGVSFGGPIVEVYGAPIPIPLSTVGATVGLTETVDIHAAFHPTAAVLMGVVEFDAGASWMFLENSGAVPRLMGDLMLVGAGGNQGEGDPEGGFRLFLQPSLMASWDWGKKQKLQSFYTGPTVFFQPFPEVHAVGGWVVGQRFGFSPKTHLDLELKWMAPYGSTENLVLHYYSPGNLGAISFQLGFGFKFGKKEGG
jgi:hypothetical protein